jgi:hypothetical protein
MDGLTSPTLLANRPAVNLDTKKNTVLVSHGRVGAHQDSDFYILLSDIYSLPGKEQHSPDSKKCIR